MKDAPKITLEKAAEYLMHTDQFKVFITWIRGMREAEIGTLRGKSPNEVMEISGRIQALDDILNVFDQNT